MALFIAKSPKYRSRQNVPGRIGVPVADLRGARAENEAINRLGTLLGIRADEMKQERDAAVVGDLYNQWRDADREQLSQLLQKKGKDAVDLDRDYDQFFTKSQGKADESAENGSQQAMVNDMLSRKREQNLDILARYEVVEGQRYKAAQGQGIIANAVSDGRDAGFDDVKLTAAIAEEHTWFRAAHPGASDEEISAHAKMVESEVKFANMQSRINENPTAALITLEKWKEELGEGYFKLKDKAEVAQKTELINTLQSTLQTKYEEGGVPNFGKMRQELTDLKDVPKDVKFEVRNWIDAIEVQYKSKEKQLQNEGQKAEDRAIGNAFMDGDYQGVLKIARDSIWLTGAEKKAWKNAVTSANKQVDEEIPVNEQIAEMVEINRKIANPANKPEDIIKYIQQSSKLKKEDKEERIERVNKKVTSEQADGRKFGYKMIENLIIPKRGMQSKIMQHPIEYDAIIRGQSDLDNWMDSQERAGNSVTLEEIKKKSREIAESRRPSIADINRARDEESRKQYIESGGDPKDLE